MSTGAYLIPSGFKEGTSLFVRAMSWGYSDNGGSPATSLPSGAHQMIFINEEEPVFSNTKKTLISPTCNNGGFDIAGTHPEEFEDWRSSSQATSQVEYDSAGAYSGAGALRFDVVNGNIIYVTNKKAVVTSGDTIEYEFWAKASDGTKKIAIQCGQNWYSHDATTEWQKFTGSFIANGDNILMIRKTSVVSYSLWVDNLTVRAISPDNVTGYYDSFENLGTLYPCGAIPTLGYLATFIKPDYTSGFYISESHRYNTWPANVSGSGSASGFLSKLQEQPQGTLLVLSTNDEPASTSNIFKEELENNWGAEYIKHVAATGTAELENGPNGNPKFRSSYVLVASKGQGKIYEDYANSGEGPVGFCGWVKNKAYETGMWYTESDAYFGGSQTTAYARTSIDWGDYDADTSIHAVGFFKTERAGRYIFELKGTDVSYFWFGDQSASGFDNSNYNIKLPGGAGVQTGYYTGNLQGNTYYPFRLQHGFEDSGGVCRLYYKYQDEEFSSELPVYHINYQTGSDYLGSYISSP